MPGIPAMPGILFVNSFSLTTWKDIDKSQNIVVEHISSYCIVQ